MSEEYSLEPGPAPVPPAAEPVAGESVDQAKLPKAQPVAYEDTSMAPRSSSGPAVDETIIVEEVYISPQTQAEMELGRRMVDRARVMSPPPEAPPEPVMLRELK